MKTPHKWALIAGLMFLSMAPTPGAVGSCGGDDQNEPADFLSYCEQREQLICVRKYLRKEITARERDTCRWAGIDACELRSFPRECQPTERQTQTCLNALSSFDTLHTKEKNIAECSTHALCTVTPSETDVDAGGFGP